MLAQFFRKPSSHTAPNAVLDSATEESHTRFLLFPDTAVVHNDGQPYPLHGAALNSGSGHDGPLPEIDLEYPRDCRIIIAQDEFMSTPKSILYDSKLSPSRVESPTHPQARSRVFSGAGSANTAGPTFGGMHARRSSLVTESTTPRSPTAGAFTRTRTRGSSISSMPNIDEHGQAQATAQGKATDSIDVVKTCLDCMFGNTTMSYRGNSNKLHIVPLDSRTSDTNAAVSNILDVSSSFGKSEGFRRRSHLAKSFTPGNLPNELPRIASKEEHPKEPPRRTIFITRMFSVVLPDEDVDTSNMRTPQSSLGQGNGFPFPRASTKTGATKGPQPPQARKTPMYAIAVILHLPVASSTMRPPSRPGPAMRGPNHLSTSAPGQDSLGSSFDSDRRAGWTSIDLNFGVDSLMSASMNSDVDDRVDVIGQHWDVITRTLTNLQNVVQERILAHFKAMEVSSPSPSMSQLPRNQPTRYLAREGTFPPSRRGWRLQPNALAFDQIVKDAVERAGSRVVSGMRIPRVLTGQGKWGVWREEARWLGRWAGGRDENFFFFTLLTAFLGNHTEWLNLLGPKSYRKRHREQQKSNASDDLTIRNRTVIVSPDKMAARRLIYLLANFLPANTSNAYDSASPMRPSTSASLRAYSQSPPTNMPPSRKHSLRRQINRRPRGKQSFTNMRQPQAVAGTSLSTLESANGRSEPGVGELHEPPRHSRRSSAHSIQTSLMLPSMSDSVATKSSSASMSTVTPQDAVPIAHFTLPRTNSSGPSPELHYRPESSDSLASANLMSTLKRSSTGHTSNPSTDSGNTSRWSGFMSFWSGGRRDSSTDHGEYLQTTDDGLGISSQGYRATEQPRSRLEQMVQELSMNRETFEEPDVYEPTLTTATATAESSPETFPLGGSSGVPPSAARPIPERVKQHEPTLKMSVNQKDGVIDVEIPLPDFGSPLQSPLLGGYPSGSSQPGSSFGESSVLSMPYVEPEQPVNAAGWLKQFHPDFAVQAIRPYTELDRDIKRAMSAEPTPIPSAATPTLEQGPQERWIDVCSALVADTHTFSIKRISLRRLVKLIPAPTYHQAALTPGIAGVPARSQYGNPYSAGMAGPQMTEVNLDEQFSEELIMDFDATLIDAVDRVLALSNQATRVQSASSSRSSSRRGRRDTRSGSDAGHHHQDIGHIDPKGIIFDALEAVVKDVTVERNAKGSNTGSSGEKRSIHEVGVRTATDSSLKEGIRRWLAEVE